MKNRFLTLITLLSLPILASADELNGGDTAWMLVATAFVMLMTPAGLALFYGGMTRSKNVLNTMGMSLIAQFKAIGLTVIYSAVMTAVLFYISSALTGGGRVDAETEYKGLDEAIHGEKGMNL
jgi:ammonia channel protein AmtB